MKNEVVMDEISGEFIPDWVTRKMAASDIGVSEHVINGWISRHLTRDKQYKVIGKQTFINRKRLQEWITLKISGLTETESKSDSSTKVRSIHSMSKDQTKLQLPERYR